MPQSSVAFGVLFVAWIVFITQRGDLARWLGVFGLAPAAPGAPAAPPVAVTPGLPDPLAMPNPLSDIPTGTIA